MVLPLLSVALFIYGSSADSEQKSLSGAVMATIKYRFSDGTTSEIEVTEEFAAEYAETEHKEYLVNRKETRRHQSLDKSLEHGFDVADPKVNISEEIERREMTDKLHKAIAALSPEQQELLRQVYFEYIPQTEIAEKEGVTKKAINNRLARILQRLKKFLN